MTAMLMRGCPGIGADDVTCGINGKPIVRGVTVDIHPGARCAIVGMNGAGKSTLLRALAGLTSPLAGAVTLDGDDVHAMASRDRARRIAFVGQEESPPDDLLVHEVVALGRTPHRSPWSAGGATEARVVAESLASVDMADKADRPSGQLSGGERRRVMVARGFAQQAPIMMLDEPTNHLDVRWQIRLLTMLGDYPGTVVAAIHDLDVVYRFFTQVVVVAGGTVLATGHPHDVLTPEVVAEAFGVCATTCINPQTGNTHLITYDIYRAEAHNTYRAEAHNERETP